MATIQPFRPYLYTDRAGPLSELVAPPYDVIPEAERRRLRAQRPAAAIHVILPQGEDKYATAAGLLDRWKAEKLLEREPKPAMYLYAQGFEVEGQPFERFGLLTSLRLEELDSGIVLPHERTLEGPKKDRMQLLRACRMNLSPVFAFVDAPLGLARLLDRGEPIADFTDLAGVRQRLFRLTEPALLEDLAARVASQPVFIADGHHRYETALAYRRERRQAEGDPPEPQPYDFVLTHLCSTRDAGLVVLPTHRLLSRADPHTDLLERWRQDCTLTEFEDAPGLWTALEAGPVGERVPRVGIVRRGLPGGWLLEAGRGARERLRGHPPELAILDVTFLHDVVLEGIPADRFDYTHDASEALSAVENGRAELAALLPPPDVNDVLQVARAGLTMPQKSTYFHPKVLSGLAYHPLD